MVELCDGDDDADRDGESVADVEREAETVGVKDVPALALDVRVDVVDGVYEKDDVLDAEKEAVDVVPPERDMETVPDGHIVGEVETVALTDAHRVAVGETDMVRETLAEPEDDRADDAESDVV